MLFPLLKTIFTKVFSPSLRTEDHLTKKTKEDQQDHKEDQEDHKEDGHSLFSCF